MAEQDDQIEVDELKATAAEGTGHVRWMLIIGTALAIGLLTIIWVTGALTFDEGERVAQVSENVPDPVDDGGSEGEGPAQ